MISARTRLAAVLGDPVEHSVSPQLHNAAFTHLGIDAVYLALAVKAGRLESLVAALADMNCLGASVTVPHKKAVEAACDRLAPSAVSVGAVNCLEFREGEVVGHNTDAHGFAAALVQQVGERSEAWRPLILGGGGAARAVDAAMRSMSSEPAVVVARNPSRVDWADARPWTADELATHLRRVNLVVDATSAGLSPATESSVPADIDVSLCAPATVVASLVYHRQTRLLAAAATRGLPTLDGLGMLVHQAHQALHIWLGQAPPPAILHAAAPHRG